MNAPLPMTSKLVRVGLQLAEMRQSLGRVPTAEEIRAAFSCSKATAMRYQAAVRGTRIGWRLPAASPSSAQCEISDAAAKLMAEFGFTREGAANVLAYESGEGLPA